MAQEGDREPGRALLVQVSDRMKLLLSVVEGCVQQLDDSQIWYRADEKDNAIANLMLHLAGSLRQSIVVGVGRHGVDTRNRDAEFAARGGMSRDQALGTFRDAVLQSCGVIDRLTAEAITGTCLVQNVERPVAYLLVLAVAHMGVHIGQIQLITRTLRRAAYKETWANPPRK